MVMKSSLGNDEQKAMFLVDSISVVQFSFEHPFFACSIGLASNIACPKNWALKNIFVQLCIIIIVGLTSDLHLCKD